MNIELEDKKFGKTLARLAKDKGYPTQTSLAKAMGIGQGTVTPWYRDRNAPVPNTFGQLLILLTPEGNDYEDFIDGYGQLLSREKGVRVIHKSEASDNPLAAWIEDFCERRRMTIKQFGIDLGVGTERSTFHRASLSLTSISTILQNAGQAFNLNEKEMDCLSDKAAATIEMQFAKGHRFQDNNGRTVMKMQQKIPGETYNGAQVGRTLGVSREDIRMHRNRLKLPLVLTAEHVKIISQKIKVKK